VTGPDRTSPVEGFLTAVRSAPDRALVALDVDGTLAPIVERPEAAMAVAGSREAIARLTDAGVTVALISGRTAADVLRIVGLEPSSRVIVLGQYGLERWQAGALTAPPPVPGIAAARQRLPAVLEGAPAGVHVEDKKLALVVHTRPAADPAAALGALRSAVEGLAVECGLEAIGGRAVIELRPAGIDKGTALAELARDHAPTAVCYVGDDVADLAAFATLRSLRAGGTLVLAVASVDPATTDTDPRLAATADLVLAGPRAVTAWLERLLPASDGGTD